MPFKPGRLIIIAERWGQGTTGGRDTNSRVVAPMPNAATGIAQAYPIGAPGTNWGGAAQSNPSGAIRVSHGDKSNFLYADSHVESKLPLQTWPVKGGRETFKNEWYVQ